MILDPFLELSPSLCKRFSYDFWTTQETISCPDDTEVVLRRRIVMIRMRCNFVTILELEAMSRAHVK